MTYALSALADSPKRVTLANVVLSRPEDTHFPAGPLQIAAVFAAAGWRVDFRDYQLYQPSDPMNVDTLCDFLETRDPVIAIGCYFNLLPLVALAAEKIKKRWPEKTIILGGPGPSQLPEALMRAFPAIDIIVRGEGEETLAELLKTPRARSVKGVVARCGGGVTAFPPRSRIADLGKIPALPYGMVNMKRYRCIAIQTMRGCPFGCKFCEVSPLWGNMTRFRDIESVLAELEMLSRRFGVNYVRIADDTLTLKREHLLTFCRRLKQRLPALRWSCMGRVDRVDAPVLDAMAEAGCVGIQYGIESGSQEILNRLGRNYAVEQAVEAIALSAARFNHVVTSYIWGFPFESMEQFYMTISLMSKAAALGADIKLLPLMPLPNSPLFKEFGSRLTFSPSHAAGLILSGYGGGKEETGKRAGNKPVLNAIRSRPELFPGFYYYESPTFRKKARALKGFQSLLA